ncbi:MAG: alpha/beta hydrolase [Cellvibrionaceae bacterium]|nr:alpha/beta hydrolase [Cellvibrionaceae bacterium]
MNIKTATLTLKLPGQSCQVVYTDWGNKESFPIVCVHGLTGNGHDFDMIAPHLVAEGYRVIAIDLPGRGRSDFLRDPQGYNYQAYLLVISHLLDSLNITELDWLGVSLGGLLGMRIIAEQKFAVRRLILNDIGPEVPKAALDYIYQVIRVPYYFDSVEALEQRMRETRGLTWGPVTDEQWAHMAKHNARYLENGRYTYAYDANIAPVFEREPIGEMDLWPCWETIHSAVLVLQGAKSALLTDAILQQMRTCGPSFQLSVFDDCGHVPSLMAPAQVRCVVDWLK